MLCGLLCFSSGKLIALPNLKGHKKRQKGYIKSLKPEFIHEDHHLVFTSENGIPLNPRNLSQRHFEKVLENAKMNNLGFVLYSLRHSCATLLLAAGKIRDSCGKACAYKY
jgi:site-specific recombinase XerD